MKELLAGLPLEPDAAKVVDLITKAFERLADRGAYYDAMQTVIPGVGVIYGVRVPLLRKLAKGVRGAYRQDQEGLKAIALASWEQGSREHELFGLFLLGYVKKISPAERWELGERFLPQVSHWEACDQLCAALLGEALAQDARYMNAIEAWVGDGSLWVRGAPNSLRRWRWTWIRGPWQCALRCWMTRNITFAKRWIGPSARSSGGITHLLTSG